jgi:restriction endonuclease S subunit
MIPRLVQSLENLESDLFTDFKKALFSLYLNKYGTKEGDSELVSNEIPALSNLKSISISQFADISKGKTPIKQSKRGVYPLFTTAEDIGNTDHFDFESDSVVIPLVSSSGHGHASINRIHLAKGKFAAGSILAVVSVEKESPISSRFLFEYLSTFKEELLVSRMAGTANVSLNVGLLKDIKVPIIPSKVQDELDQVFDCIDQIKLKQVKIENKLANLIEHFEDFGSTSTKDAFDILKMKIDIFKSHSDVLLSSSSGLAEVIKLESEAAITGTFYVKTKQMKMVVAPDWIDSLPHLSSASRWKESKEIEDSEKSDRYPQDWQWFRLNDLGLFINGYAFKPSDWSKTGKPILRIQNLSAGGSSFNRTKLELSQDYWVEPGDILVSWSATLDAFLWGGESALLNQHIFRVVPNESLITSEYLFMVLKQAILDLSRGEHKHGLTMKHINRAPFLNHVVAIPDIETQLLLLSEHRKFLKLSEALRTNSNTLLSSKRNFLNSVRSLALSSNLIDMKHKVG